MLDKKPKVRYDTVTHLGRTFKVPVEEGRKLSSTDISIIKHAIGRRHVRRDRIYRWIAAMLCMVCLFCFTCIAHGFIHHWLWFIGIPASLVISLLMMIWATFY